MLAGIRLSTYFFRAEYRLPDSHILELKCNFSDCKLNIKKNFYLLINQPISLTI